jgi:iron(III) transport system substrate-binding protein
MKKLSRVLMLALLSCGFLPPALSWSASDLKPWGPMSDIEAAARKEGKVTIYSAPGHALPPDQQAIGAVMKDKYGITVEWISLSARDIGPRVLVENRTRRHVADIIMSGETNTIEHFAPRGLVQPILAPSTLEKGVWRLDPARNRAKDRDWLFIFFGIVPSFIVNTQLVPPRDEPKSYKDLLHSKWKGKIVIENPGQGGSGSGWFRATYRTLGLDFMNALGKQVALVRVGAEVPDSVARGQYAIGISPTVARSRELIQAGAPLKFVEAKEGLHITSQGMSFLTGVPHPNAAKVFINWFYSREGQTVYNQHHQSVSLRKDVPQDHLSPQERYVDGRPFFIQSLEDVEPGRPAETLILARKIFEEGK